MLHDAGAFVAEAHVDVLVVRVGAAEAGVRDADEDGVGGEVHAGGGCGDFAGGRAAVDGERWHVGCGFGNVEREGGRASLMLRDGVQ